ncbi:MAG: PA2169 family four-helix-bundle protein [Pyrinomonadaceae bacterium]
MTNENIISTINNLIQTCKDGQNGFKDAAEGVERSDMKSLFYECSQQRAQFAGQLQAEVRKLGGEPEEDGSFSGTLHQGWMNLKAALTGNDETAVLNECERGEDSAVKAYRQALEQDLPADIRTLVQTQADKVKITHDRIKGLRDVSRAATS